MSVRDSLRKATGIVPARPIYERDVPTGWTMARYAPGQPIRPLEAPWEEGVPREIDYNLAANTTIVPRTNYSLVPFSLLRDTYDLITEVKLVMMTLQREALVLEPKITVEDGDALDPKARAASLLVKPDGVLPWSVWLSRFYRNLIILDAPCCYFDVAARALRIVQGDTIFPIIDQHGRKPLGMDPAYAQIIKGTAMQWFTADELWYAPMQLRDNAPYGESFIEVAWTHIMLCASIMGFELAHYKQGNMPEGWLMPPEDMSPDEVIAWEQNFNDRMMSGISERNRVRVLPGKWTYVGTKKPDFPKEAYEKALQIIGLAGGIATMNWGQMPGRLGGSKGQADVMNNQTYRQGTHPVQLMTRQVMNAFLQVLGEEDLTFTLTMPATGLDPTAQALQTLQNFANGLVTLNEARTALGLKSVKDGDIRVVIRNGQIVSMDEFIRSQAEGVDKATDEKAHEAAQDAAMSRAEESPDDTELARRVVQSGSTNPGTTVSVPRLSKVVAQDMPMPTILKSTGLTDADDDYYQAPVHAAGTIQWPDDHHANTVEIVSLCPLGLPEKTGLFKPFSGENANLVAKVGGPQANREEAAYILDRRLQLYLVPVAYVARVNGQVGAVCMYSSESQPRRAPDEYAPYWLERAALLDYLDGDVDRNKGNWLTACGDETRPVMIDNGMSFPTENMPIFSPFVAARANMPVDPALILQCQTLVSQVDFWAAMTRLVGPAAVTLFAARLKSVIDTGELRITAPEAVGGSTGETTIASHEASAGEVPSES